MRRAGDAGALMTPERGGSPGSSRWISLIGNLIGALIVFGYFRFIDNTAADLPRLGWHEIVFSVVATEPLHSSAIAWAAAGRRHWKDGEGRTGCPR